MPKRSSPRVSFALVSEEGSQVLSEEIVYPRHPVPKRGRTSPQHPPAQLIPMVQQYHEWDCLRSQQQGVEEARLG